MENIYFEKITDKTLIIDLENEWRKTLTFPNDDFWEAQIDAAQYWIIKQAEEMIGYVCLSHRNTLYQYYISAQWLDKGLLILEDFIKQKEIKKARIETNNPICLSLSMHFQKSVLVDGYTFGDMVDVSIEAPKGDFRIAKSNDLEKLVDFFHRVMDAPKDWSTTYISNLISREEFFLFERDNKIIGTSEARTTPVNAEVASLGIITCPDHRNQGIGSYLLNQAKAISKSRNQQAICGCGRDNISSLKVIEKNGFRILHTSFLIDFEEVEVG